MYFQNKSSVFFKLQFTAVFIGLTIWSVLLYVDLNDEQIDPNTKTVMYMQYIVIFSHVIFYFVDFFHYLIKRVSYFDF